MPYTDNFIKVAIGYNNAIFQNRKDFCAVYGFEMASEAIEKLKSMSYSEDRTFVYYNNELYSAKEFKAKYENYGGNYENDSENETEECECCNNGVCEIKYGNS